MDYSLSHCQQTGKNYSCRGCYTILLLDTVQCINEAVGAERERLDTAAPFTFVAQLTETIAAEDEADSDLLFECVCAVNIECI